MENYDGMYELRTFYETTPTGESPMLHVFTIDAYVKGTPEPGTAFSSIDTQLGDSSLSDLETDTDALMALVTPFFAPATAFIRSELWQYDAEPSTNATFIAVYPLGLTGTGSGTAVAAAQNTLTYRTLGGGIMRVQFMEAFTMNNTKDAYPFSAAIATNLSNYLCGLLSPFLARDNTRPISPIYYSQTQNEKLYRKRYRLL